MKAQQDSSSVNKPWPLHGCGVGLRTDHYEALLNEWPVMDWFEAISENFMDSGGRPLRILEQVRSRYPVALHGVSLSIGSVDPLHPGYLERLKALVDRIDPFLVSDHLCWSGVDRQQLHDLLPLPFTEEAVQHVVSRVQQVQECLKRPILLENVSTYVTYRHSTMTEWDFLMEVVRRSGCGILLDLNNIYVNSRNHGFDSLDYLRGIDGTRVAQFHLAGHTDMGDFLFDTHSGEVIDPVWQLYRVALKMWGRVSTLVEWDEKIPAFDRLAAEAERAREIYLAAPAHFPAGYRFEAPHSSVPAPRLSVSEIPSLLEAQRTLKSFIRPSQELRPSSHTSILNPQGHASGEERMEVYAGGYAARMRDALDDVYEAIHRILGEKVFWELAQDYASSYPSQEYNLSLAGRNFPEFLKDHPVSRKFPFLSDLACLERQVSEAFHAFDGPPLTPGQLQNLGIVDFEQSRLVFQPSVSICSSAWPIVDLWRARNAPAGKIDVDLVNRPQNVLVGRCELKVICLSIDFAQYTLLRELLAGRTLGQACETLAVSGADAAALSEWFAQWMGSGLLSGVELSVGSPRP